MPYVVSVDLTGAKYYGCVWAAAFQKYAPAKRRRPHWSEQLIDPVTGLEMGIEENDLWLAAQAIQYNLTMVTHDSGFRRISEALPPDMHLDLVDWAG